MRPCENTPSTGSGSRHGTSPNVIYGRSTNLSTTTRLAFWNRKARCMCQLRAGRCQYRSQQPINQTHLHLSFPSCRLRICPPAALARAGTSMMMRSRTNLKTVGVFPSETSRVLLPCWCNSNRSALAVLHTQ